MRKGNSDLHRILTPLLFRLGAKTQGNACLLNIFHNGYVWSTPPVLSTSALTIPLCGIYHRCRPLKGEERLNSLSKATPLKSIQVGTGTQVQPPTSIHQPALLWDVAQSQCLAAGHRWSFSIMQASGIFTFLYLHASHLIVQLYLRQREGRHKLHSFSRCLVSSLSEIWRRSKKKKKSMPKIRFKTY